MRTYATPSSVRETEKDLNNWRQKSNETETELSTRIETAEYLCANVHSNSDKIKLLVDVLNSQMRTIVARYRGTNEDCQ